MSIIDVPTHPGTGQTLLELLHAPLYGTGANREALFAELKVLHPLRAKSATH